MYFVIQVESKKEDILVHKLREAIPMEISDDIFSPKKKRLKKYLGEWHVVEDSCFRGFIFVRSTHPHHIFSTLKTLDDYTKLLGSKKGDRLSFVPLSENEERLLIAMVGDKDNHHPAEISEVEVKDAKIDKVLSGPLQQYQDRIIKTDLHKRLVTISDTLGDLDTQFQLGIDIKNKKGTYSLSDIEWIGS